MSPLEALKTLEQNMIVQSDNMQSIIDSTQKKLENAVTDKSIDGRMLQEDKVNRCLSNISYCQAKQAAYDEIKGWAQQALKEVVR